MKKTSLALMLATLGLGVSASALAQTQQNNVTLYGVIDTAIRYTSNTNDSNSSRIGLDSGAWNGSRVGFKGSEDLGGGLSTIFKLEAGFSPDTGAHASENTLFNRASYLGLQGDWGRVTFGRQDTIMFEHIADFDPFEVSNIDETSFHAGYSDTTRRSNSIAYHGEFGANKEWYLGAMYGFGEQSSSNSDNTHLAISGGYKWSNFKIGAAYQRVNGKNDPYLNGELREIDFRTKQDVFGLGGTYTHNDWLSFYAGYLNARLDDQPIIAGKRKNDVFYGGVVANVDQWIFRGGFWTDRLKGRNNVVDKNGDIVAVGPDTNGKTGNESGRRYAYAASAEYRLSKRTGIYAEIDYSRVRNGMYDDGQLGRDPNATDKTTSRSRTGMAVGIRHFF